MPKILYVIATGNPGGAEKQAANLIHQMVQRGIDAKLGIYYGFGDMPGNLREFVEANNIPHVNFGPMNRPYAVQGWFQGEAPDMVIGCGYPTGLTTAMLALRAGVNTRVIRLESVGHVRDQFPTPEDEERGGMQAATHIVGNSQAVVDSIPLYSGGDIHKGHVIANGVHVPELTQALRDRAKDFWGCEPHELIVGLLANFRPDGIKNQPMFVRAAKKALGAYPYTRFIMAGYHTEYADTIQRMVDERGLHDVVRLPGRLDDLDMLAGWDIAVNCSTTEGLSNAVMECMSYGLPCVITNVGGNKALAEHTGVWSVPSDDDEAMAKQLQALMGTATHSNYLTVVGQHARQSIIDNYSWDKVIEQWLDLM
jgi:glycosyltransferase involved in cell wall biosynthesis